MTRVLGITLLALVLAGVATLALGGRQFQRTMSGRIDSLSEQLGTLAKTQEEMLAQQTQNLPVQIKGRAYLGDPSRPAANAELIIYAAVPRRGIEPMRRVITDTDGAFRSGPLPQGAYFVHAPLLDPEGNRTWTGHGFQSRPLHLYEGNEEAEVELDLLAQSEVLYLTRPHFAVFVAFESAVLAANPSPLCVEYEFGPSSP